MTPDSFEGKLVLSMEDALSQLHSMWVEGIKNASKDVNTSVSSETSLASEETTKNTAKNDGVRFSIIRTKNMSWEDQIESALKRDGNIKRNDTLVVEVKPYDYLLKENISDLPFAVPLRVVTKAKSGKDDSHSISDDNLMRLKDGMKNAQIVINNPSRNSIVFVTDIKQSGKPILIAFSKDAIFDGDQVHKSTSVHLQMDLSGLLHSLDENAVIYLKNKKELDSEVGVTNNLRSLASQIKFIDEILSQNNDEVKNNSLRDNEYLEAVNNGDMETAQRMVDEYAEEVFANSKIRDEDGKLLKVYHGTYEDFTVFDKSKGRTNMDIQGMFFSPWEIDARGYGPNVRAFYLNITNPADERTGYSSLHKYKGQTGAGVKARDYLVKLGYDGVNNENEEFIAFNSVQIKSADPVTYDDNGDVIPLSERFNEENEDIRYSERLSYDALVSKPDMRITEVSTNIPSVRTDIIALAKNNAKLVGKESNNTIYVHVDDIDANVVLGTDGLRHGLRRLNSVGGNMNAIVTIKAGEIIKNSILINELIPAKLNAIKSYILVGVARSHNGDLYLVRSIINSFNNNLESVDVLYAINTKKELAATKSPRYAKDSLSVTSSTISISDLLDLVNKYFPDVLPENVLKHYGYDERPSGDLGDNILYQARPTLDDFIFDDFDGEITDTDAFLMSQYITGDVRTISHIVNNTKNIDISDAKINQVVSRLVKSYDLSDSYNKDIKVAVIMLVFELVCIFNKQTVILSH